MPLCSVFLSNFSFILIPGLLTLCWLQFSVLCHSRRLSVLSLCCFLSFAFYFVVVVPFTCSLQCSLKTLCCVLHIHFANIICPCPLFLLLSCLRPICAILSCCFCSFSKFGPLLQLFPYLYFPCYNFLSSIPFVFVLFCLLETFFLLTMWRFQFFK